MKNSKVKGFLAGELVSQAEIDRLKLGEMAPAAGVDLATLTAKTPDPFFVYVRAGRVGLSNSTVNQKRRNWLPKTLERIVEALPLYGYRGHPDPEQFKKQRTWRDFVTVWVAGKIVDGALYLKGFIPASEKDFQELIQLTLAAGNPMQVSPFGTMLGREQANTWDVEDFEAISVDWGQPGDAGFDDADVLKVAGETSSQTNQEDRMEEELKQAKAEAARLGGELKSAQDQLKAANEKVTTLEGTVTQIGGELKTLKEQAEVKVKAEVKTHRETLLGKLPEPERELGGELLTGETVADLDKNFEVVVGKLKKARPGLRIIGGETKEQGQEEGQKEQDFAG